MVFTTDLKLAPLINFCGHVISHIKINNFDYHVLYIIVYNKVMNNNHLVYRDHQNKQTNNNTNIQSTLTAAVAAAICC